MRVLGIIDIILDIISIGGNPVNTRVLRLDIILPGIQVITLPLCMVVHIDNKANFAVNKT